LVVTAWFAVAKHKTQKTGVWHKGLDENCHVATLTHFTGSETRIRYARAALYRNDSGRSTI